MMGHGLERLHTLWVTYPEYMSFVLTRAPFLDPYIVHLSWFYLLGNPATNVIWGVGGQCWVELQLPWTWSARSPIGGFCAQKSQNTVPDRMTCADYDDWADKDGEDCKTHKENAWCTLAPGPSVPGIGWHDEWGTDSFFRQRLWQQFSVYSLLLLTKSI